ncbi:MAG: hypothetical protein HW380_2679 [Magnetococcales bacterium]|nr:hypothetical protein [Magnetococcales bacterium]
MKIGIFSQKEKKLELLGVNTSHSTFDYFSLSHIGHHGAIIFDPLMGKSWTSLTTMNDSPSRNGNPSGKFSSDHLTRIVKARTLAANENSDGCEGADSCVRYYIVRKKIIIKFYNDLSQSLMRDVRLITKKIDFCDEVVLDMTKASCSSMSGLGVLAYIFMNSQNHGKKISVITNDENIKEVIVKYWKNVKVL